MADTDLIERLKFHGRYVSETQAECTERKNAEREEAATALSERAKRIAVLEASLERLVNANALSGVRAQVAGWNGENRPEGPYSERHLSRLGARIETNCGRIYELDEIMQEARAALSQKETGA